MLYPCAECGKEISEKATACPSCGAAWSGVCPECHNFRAPSDDLCKKCGYPFSDGKRLAENDESAAVPTSSLGESWLNFWAYVGIPLVAIISAGYGVLAWYSYGADDVVFMIGLILFIVAGFQVSVAIGLAKRRLWGLKSNWLLIYMISAAFFLPLTDANDQVEAATMIVGGLIASAIWLLPNHIYWRKRQDWFG